MMEISAVFILIGLTGISKVLNAAQIPTFCTLRLIKFQYVCMYVYVKKFICFEICT